MLVNVDTKFIIAQQELVITGSEHPQRSGRITSSGELGMLRVFSLGNCDTIKVEKVHYFESFRTENGYPSLEENDVERVRG